MMPLLSADPLSGRLGDRAVPELVPFVGGVILLALCYGLMAKLGLNYSTLTSNVTLLWPPTGLSLFVFLRYGSRYWPGIVAGDLIANWGTGATVPAILGIAAGNVLQTFLCAWLLQRLVGFHDRLDRVRDVLYLLSLGTACAAVSATLGPASLALDGRFAWSLYGSVWLQWLMGDATGVLVLTPLLLAWIRPSAPRPDRGRAVEALALLVLLLAATEAVFGGLGLIPHGYYPAALALFPLVMWGALRFGLRGATSVTLIISMAAIWGTSQGRGPFVLDSGVDSLVHWWVFANVITITSLVLAASRAERARAQHELERERDFVSTVLDTESALVAVIDGEGRIVRANRALTDLIDRPVHEILGCNLAAQLIDPANREKVEAHRELLRRRIASTVRFEAGLARRVGNSRLVSWSATTPGDSVEHADYTIVTGIDITERNEATQALRAARRELEARVAERTLDLKRANIELKAEIAVRRRLETEIIRVSEHEQMRIGRELHDGLGQHLTATAFQCEFLERRLAGAGRDEARDAAMIGQRIAEAVSDTRLLARGLHPVELEAGGLMAALEQLAANAKVLFRIECTFQCPKPVPVHDNAVAINLYRIVQEALTNAAKHSGATRIGIFLESEGGRLRLRIADDGRGLDAEPARESDQGMGLHIMQYRAKLIGAELALTHSSAGGLEVGVTAGIATGVAVDARH